MEEQPNELEQVIIIFIFAVCVMKLVTT